MNVSAGIPAAPAASRLAPRQARGLRLASLAAFVMLLVQYGLGSYLNLYVTVPAADHGHGLGTALPTGPAALTVHAVLGLLLAVSALVLTVRAVASRAPAVIALSVAGLLAVVAAAFAGAGFASTGRDSASLAMALTAGAALLCDGLILFLVPRIQPAQ